MKKLLPTLIFLLFPILFASAIPTQTNKVSFRQISPPGGFALKGIYSISQDQLGYIWMGTDQGLIRYDTNKSTWFRPSANDSLSIPSSRINNIFTDKNNTVWVSTGGGLCLFDREKQGFKKIQYHYEDGKPSNCAVLSSFVTQDNTFLILDANYFGYYNPEKKELTRIGSQQIQSPTKVYVDNNNRIWVGTLSGEVFRFYPSTNEIKKVIAANGMRVNTIYADNDRIWIGYDGNGAKIFSLRGDLLKHYTSITSDNTKHQINNVRVIKRDTYGRIWFGAYEGLFMDDGKRQYYFNPDDYPGIPHNSIFDIFEDRQGIIWIGTWSGGVAFIHHSDNHFQTFRHNTSKNSISNNMVSSFLQMNENEILIGTEVGGLNAFNPITERFTQVPLSTKTSIKNIKTLCKDKNGGIWVGTFKKGLWYRPPGSNTFKPFQQGIEDGKHISASSVYSMCAVDSGVWIGTFESGINFYNFKTRTIQYCFKDSINRKPLQNFRTQTIVTDSNSNLWLGTLNGLYRIHLPTEEIIRIKHPTYFSENGGNTIYCLLEHPSGNLWIGTKSQGILIYHPKSNLIEPFEANNLLKGKEVYGIIEDQNHKIWISSNNGLIVWDPRTQEHRNFVYEDGIQSNLFCPQSVYEDLQHNLYFGGTNGFTRINPSKVRINSKTPVTIISEVVTKKSRAIHPSYSKDLKIKKIILDPGESTLRINFWADNYLMPGKNRYQYRLINSDNDWIETQNESSALFKSLKAGEYLFEVKACNNDGIWNNSPTQMAILIKSYWYKTTLAYLVYLLLLLSLFYFIGRSYFERLKLKRNVLREKSQRENEEQIHEMKLKFFTNISHEFRTPLTLISWPLEKIIKAKNLTVEQREELEVVKRNANRLLQLINQIVDLRKLEKGKSKLNISQINLVEFIKEMQQGFSSEAKANNIRFVLKTPYPSLIIEADHEKLDTIIYNLLSNAYKYVSQNGQISISINRAISTDTQSYTNQLSFGEIEDDDCIEISVEDSGLGIDSEDLLNIFNRFEQGKTSDRVKGSGIGLSLCKEYTLLHGGKITAQSTPGSGSRFTLLLPRKQKAQKILFESHHEFKNLKTIETSTVQLKQEKKKEKLSHILVVEDNPDFRSFICKFLNQYYQVDYALNGEEALAILKQRDIDLIVSDVMMPKMDGFEFCSIVKAQIATSHIPVILLTALSSSENLIAGLDKGADAYLTKPFEEKVLVKQIENILEQRRRIRDNFSQQFISKQTIEVGGLDNFFLKKVRSVVEKNISNENFGMETLADELMISRTHLHRKIKSLSGMTTSEFVNLIRIKRAVELIQTDNCPFSEAAFQVGFSSQSYFTKCFKKVYHMPPKEYFGKQ